MRTLSRAGVFLSLAASVCAVVAFPKQQPGQVATSNTAGSASYVLGPGDQIEVKVVEAPEAGGTFIISTGGDVSTTLGRIRAAGRTTGDVQSQLVELLKVTVKQPHVTVNITALRSQPVTVTGFVANPGVQQLEGRKNLLEVIAQAGRTADAGSLVTITRKIENGTIPLNSATVTPDGRFSIAKINARSIENGTQPEENILILPFDSIFIDRAPKVHVIGEVKKPGTYFLNDSEDISVFTLIVKAEGFVQSTANKKDGKILRVVPGSARKEIAVNLQDLWDGKIKDIALQPEDILLVPDKGAVRKSLESILGIVPGLNIYRF